MHTAFLIQISTTIIAPSFMSAALFITLGHMVARLGPQYSRLGPGLYAIIFCSIDLISLIVQAIGGGAASGATTQKGADQGGRVMLAGIIIQMAAITLYALLALEFLIRFYISRPLRAPAAAHPESGERQGKHNINATRPAGGERRCISKTFKLMIGGLSFSTLLLFIRAVYRTIELSDGWNGRIISTQTYFNILDGLAVFGAMFILNILHPGYLLNRADSSEPSEL
ncbi:hypothetical protein BOTBODRAFT_186282 [Botryobasidium botryosum FD-172 SS1]|uniref:RTA1 like protein n=1 Tax=Botryobasidium botryosum (strain FD-172 SS1) TaxID=930990 RepID=A0A067MPG2_BOTB1|nr:hypothetical protein BOTBODRAFT_186282 [Botryobasidium botryosum FD-172 SS1]